MALAKTLLQCHKWRSEPDPRQQNERKVEPIMQAALPQDPRVRDLLAMVAALTPLCEEKEVLPDQCWSADSVEGRCAACRHAHLGQLLEKQVYEEVLYDATCMKPLTTRLGAKRTGCWT